MSEAICEACRLGTAHIHPAPAPPSLSGQPEPEVRRIPCPLCELRGDGHMHYRYEGLRAERPEPSERERIVAAAIREDGIVFTAAHHAQAIHQASALLGKRPVGRDQGFVTSANRYVSRAEAARIAHAAGQIPEPQDSLMSEQLWIVPDDARVKALEAALRGVLEWHGFVPHGRPCTLCDPVRRALEPEGDGRQG